MTLKVTIVANMKFELNRYPESCLTRKSIFRFETVWPSQIPCWYLQSWLENLIFRILATRPQTCAQHKWGGLRAFQAQTARMEVNNLSQDTVLKICDLFTKSEIDKNCQFFHAELSLCSLQRGCPSIICSQLVAFGWRINFSPRRCSQVHFWDTQKSWF